MEQTLPVLTQSGVTFGEWGFVWAPGVSNSVSPSWRVG